MKINYEAGKIPTKYEIGVGEVAYNYPDDIQYTKLIDGTVVPVSSGLYGDTMGTKDRSKSVSVEQVTGLNTQFSFRNWIINGGFGVWQRGTSFDGYTSTFTADRWQVRASVVGSCIVENTFYNMMRFSKYASLSYCFVRTAIESNSYFSGQTVTLSAKIKRISGSYRIGLDILGVNVRNSSVGLDAPTFSTDNQITISDEWETYTLTVKLPEYSEEDYTFGVAIDIRDSITGSTSDEIYIKDVQFELGDVATPFEQRSYGDELARCQRYYQYINSYWSAYYSSTTSFVQHSFPVEMRATPSLLYTFSGGISLIVNYTNKYRLALYCSGNAGSCNGIKMDAEF